MKQCERPGCTLSAAFFRWRTDVTTRGANLNEPGMKQEFVCIAHANEIREYLGGRLEPIEQPESPAPQHEGE